MNDVCRAFLISRRPACRIFHHCEGRGAALGASPQLRFAILLDLDSRGRCADLKASGPTFPLERLSKMIPLALKLEFCMAFPWIAIQRGPPRWLSGRFRIVRDAARL